MPDSKLVKLLRLAVDPRTPPEEASTALGMLRRMQVSWDDVKNAVVDHTVNEYEGARLKQFAPERRAMMRAEASRDFVDKKLWFGKYKWFMLSQVAQENYQYLLWMKENMNRLPEAFMRSLEQAILIYEPEPSAPKPAKQRAAEPTYTEPTEPTDTEPDDTEPAEPAKREPLTERLKKAAERREKLRRSYEAADERFSRFVNSTPDYPL